MMTFLLFEASLIFQSVLMSEPDVMGVKEHGWQEGEEQTPSIITQGLLCHYRYHRYTHPCNRQGAPTEVEYFAKDHEVE
jgi:hypothetical protein